MTSTQTTASRQTTGSNRAGRSFGRGLALLGAAIMASVRANAQAATRVSKKQAEAALAGVPYLRGFGAPPEVWGQSEACRRMVFKNRRAAQCMRH